MVDPELRRLQMNSRRFGKSYALMEVARFFLEVKKSHVIATTNQDETIKTLEKHGLSGEKWGECYVKPKLNE